MQVTDHNQNKPIQGRNMNKIGECELRPVAYHFMK